MTRARSVGCRSIGALLLASATWFCGAVQAKNPDAAGCADHALFTRMDNMRIVSCKTVEFDRFAFRTGKAATTSVEGRFFEIRYQMSAGGTAPSPVAIIRNHQQALAAIGGEVQFEDARYTTLKAAKDGKEIWTQVDTAWGRGYLLNIVEKKAMAQEVVANAALFESGLKTSGHVEVPGIFFDTGKAELKPESDAAVAEVAKLLKADPALKVYVVGHSDNVGALDMNTKLSRPAPNRSPRRLSPNTESPRRA
jgi:OmpA-OmpF porin, OOP family